MRSVFGRAAARPIFRSRSRCRGSLKPSSPTWGMPDAREIPRFRSFFDMTARILVVDDIPANVKLLEVRLLAEYFEVLTASSGADALEICETGKIDVVLLDIMMPGMDGFEVCRRLKLDPATAYIPVVMVTALDQVTDRIRGLEAGADDFLTKPVNDLQLMTRVKSLVRLKTLTDELRLRASTTRNIGIERSE